VIRLAIRVARADAELALAELLALAPAGVEEVDHGETIEYAVYGAPGELPALPDLRAAAGAALVDITTTEVADDWAERWRDFHRPIEVAGRLRVRSPWHEAAAGLEEIVIDPGQAFGTGAHPTTRLCLELLQDLQRGSLVDLGCGSGVIAIAAVRLGFAPVIAVDADEAAIEATARNAAENSVDVDARLLDLASEEAPAADIAIANIDLRTISLLRPAAATLVTSGYYASDRPEASGFAHVDRRVQGEWAADLFRRE